MVLSEGLPSVDTALNDTITGTEVAVPEGATIRSIQPLLPVGASVPRGRIYLEALVVRRGTSAAEQLACLWSAYVYAPGRVRASNPNFACPDGYAIVLRATQSGQGAVTNVSARVIFDDDPSARNSGAGYIHHEEPGSGQGEIVRTTIANPGAGADPASVALGSRERGRARTFVGTLTTSAVAGNRIPEIALLTAALGTIERRIASTAHSTVLAGRQIMAVLNPALQPNAGANQIIMPTPETVGEATNVWQVGTTGLDPGDAWTGLTLTTERWAVPA